MKDTAYPISSITGDFPILKRLVHNKRLVYLDNGATTQKPQQVIDAIVHYYSYQNANIHRGVHLLSQEATTIFEEAREKVRKHLNAKLTQEIIFTKGTTESINIVAHTFGKTLMSGDEILITGMEHHSNILPWQIICEEKKAVLSVIPVRDNGELDLEQAGKMLSKRVRLLSLTHVSNTLGTINPVKDLIARAHSQGIPVFVDGAQAIPHMPVDVRDLDADFYCFSGHKVYGPTGTGVLYARQDWQDKLSNYQVGGGTIKTVSFQKTVYADAPLRFEAGTPNMEGVIGLGAALDYINNLGLNAIHKHETSLLQLATEHLNKVSGMRIVGTANEKAAVLSFVVDGIHPYDIGVILDQQGVAVRTGHHCTQPLMDRYGIPGTVRASFGLYNTVEDVKTLVEGVAKAVKMLK